MRIQPVSDLHLEFDKDHGKAFAQSLPVLGDVLVLAGDVLPIRRPPHVVEMLGWFCARFHQVIYVPGNHEYYKTSPAAASALLASSAREFPNLHLLDGAVTEIDGIRFVGATLWFPPTPDEAEYRPFLADFSLIDGFVPWVHEAHARHLAFLQKEVRAGDVVVTHFLPHAGSVAPQYEDSPLNRFFLAADAQPLVEERGARLWIHGHTHVSFDYPVGKTRVVCNARGYPAEPGTSLNPALVIEV
jgi:predicted phosphodiesterase